MTFRSYLKNCCACVIRGRAVLGILIYYRASCKTIFQTKRNDLRSMNFSNELAALPVFVATFQIDRISLPLRANAFTGQAGLVLSSLAAAGLTSAA